jgi:hypothetical protein
MYSQLLPFPFLLKHRRRAHRACATPEKSTTPKIFDDYLQLASHSDPLCSILNPVSALHLTTLNYERPYLSETTWSFDKPKGSGRDCLCRRKCLTGPEPTPGDARRAQDSQRPENPPTLGLLSYRRASRIYRHQTQATGPVNPSGCHAYKSCRSECDPGLVHTPANEATYFRKGLLVELALSQHSLSGLVIRS